MESSPHGVSSSKGELSESMDFDTILETVPKMESAEVLRSHDETASEIFKIDMDAIACVPKECQENELLQLGITVYDQTKLEEQVLAQVESAFRKKEKEIKKKQAEKDLKDLVDELRMVRQRMVQIDKALAMAPKTELTKEARRQVESIKREKENKNNCLRKLEAKRRALCTLLGESLESTSNVGLGETCELEEETRFQLAEVFSKQTDNDLLISSGEMTPFGTILPKSLNKKPLLKSNKIINTNGELTDFEQFLLQNGKQNINSLPVPLRKKIPEMIKTKVNKAINKASVSKLSISDNFFCKPSTSRDFPVLKGKKKKKKVLLGSKHAIGIPPRKRSFDSMNTNYTSDPEISDIENGDTNYEENDFDKPPDKSGSEYEPDCESVNDSEIEDEECIIRKAIKTAANDVPWISVNNKKGKLDNKESKMMKNGNFKRVQDDGNEKIFLRRLREYRMQLIMEKEDKTKQRLLNEDDNDDDEDTLEFDGGFKVPSKIWSKLFRYQQTGVRWLWELHQQNCGGIIGDEMGLGKTIQVISFFAGLQISNLRTNGDKFQGLGPVVLVCPATVMHQWVKEFHKWWPPVRVGILHVSGSYSGSKDSLVRYINKSRGVIVTSYAGITHYQTVLDAYDWHYIILDEGHKIRNPDAQVTLACKQFRTSHRIILSGSPIQNNLKELWSLFDFVFPGKLGTLPIFMQQFAVPITHGGYSNASEVQVQTAYKCAVVLRDTIGPYMLRRLKSDVQMSLQLPTKNEQVLFCKLSEEQREEYKQYLESPEIAQIVEGRFQIFVGLINLRKICNHPDIYSGGPKIFAHTDIESLTEEQRYGYYKRSGKMVVVEALLRLWKEQGHRVLLFTQSRKMLLILEVFVKNRNYSYMKMDGTTGIGSRQPAIHKFNTDNSIFVFLLTTRVGGLGVNLTGANRVIIYDPDWNPSTDLQARERAWRIGQDKQVTIYRLLTSGTIEEKIYHRQIFKQFLTNRVLKDPRQRRFFKSNDLHELFTLGSEDGKGTETSAIFAGTGSEIKLSKLKKQAKKAPKSPNFSFSSQKVEKMKEIAKKLSLKMNKGNTNAGNSEEAKLVVNADTILKGTSLSEKSSDLILGSVDTKSSGKKNREPRKKSKSSRKKKKKEFEGIIFEGATTISHLVGQATFKQQEEEESKQDDYILKKLLKKASVQTALQHENIMNSSDPDYLLVEGEAERVAKEAVQALKMSRRQCLRAESGVPTWTGSNGTSGAPPAFKKRFGMKKNTKLASPVKATSTITTAKSSLVQFGKKKASAATVTNNPQPENSDTLPTSTELLEKMHRRNNMFASKRENEDDEGNLDEATSYLPGKPTEYDDMLCDIRNFIAFQSDVNGQASTGELLQAFKNKIPVNGTPVFKALLSKICIFYRSTAGTGVWKLKQEFM